jgi:hypothetical protein
VGRRLDFMMQEFNRESNTLASKSINAEVTNSAIELKVLIEQMREQIRISSKYLRAITKTHKTSKARTKRAFLLSSAIIKTQQSA